MRTLIALLLAICSVSAQDIMDPGFVASTEEPAAGGGGGSNPPASPLVNQNFEGTGYDNSESWSEFGGGTINEDYTTSPPLGSQCLYVSGGVFETDFAYTTFSAGSERWNFTIVRLDEFPANNVDIIRLANNLSAGQMGIQISGGNKFQIACGTTAATVATITTGVNYYVWWHYSAGSGANAVAELWFSTTTTKPADGSNNHAKVTDGTSTGTVQELDIGFPGGTGSSTPKIVFDHVLVDDEEILTNPF